MYCIQLGSASLLAYGKRRLSDKKSLGNAKTSILVPFKNERDRIWPLLKSINNSAFKYKETDLFTQFEFIFIDDHSTDESIEFILNELDVSCRILKLDKTSGKKYAIIRGVEQSSYNRVLTLDADVSFSEDYLFNISKTPCKSLTILPVHMQGKSSVEKLFTIEFSFLQHVTFGLAGFGKYILCNGANLLFTKETFNQAIKVREDAHIPSGDDMFLLKAVNTLNMTVFAFNRKELNVVTSAPDSFVNLLNQRLRWITKTRDVSSLFGATFILLFNVLLFVCVYHVLLGDFWYALPILIKIVSEGVSVGEKSNLFLLLVHQVYYPFYMLVLMFKISIKSKYKWR